MDINFVLPEHLFDSLDPAEDGNEEHYTKVYLASDVDARIAELEKALSDLVSSHDGYVHGLGPLSNG